MYQGRAFVPPRLGCSLLHDNIVKDTSIENIEYSLSAFASNEFNVALDHSKRSCKVCITAFFMDFALVADVRTKLKEYTLVSESYFYYYIQY